MGVGCVRGWGRKYSGSMVSFQLDSLDIEMPTVHCFIVGCNVPDGQPDNRIQTNSTNTHRGKQRAKIRFGHYVMLEYPHRDRQTD